MSETMCKEKLGAIFNKYSNIKQILITGKRNTGDNTFIKGSMVVVIDSNDTIRGLALAKVQDDIEHILGFDIEMYERCELELDKNLKAKIVNLGKPLVISKN